jgi:hypothetical protein
MKSKGMRKLACPDQEKFAAKERVECCKNRTIAAHIVERAFEDDKVLCKLMDKLWPSLTEEKGGQEPLTKHIVNIVNIQEKSKLLADRIIQLGLRDPAQDILDHVPVDTINNEVN